MPSDPLLRFRRSAAQLHALAEVERTIRATDTSGRRQYLRDFSESFKDYRCVLMPVEVDQRAQRADVVLVGDYHALPASQIYTAGLVERLVASGREVVLGVEAIVARDQHIVEEWQRGEIDSDELRTRIHFDSGWGYDWQPFHELLCRANTAGAKICGLDCTPRQDMRSIRARDRHAAVKIDELRSLYPNAVLIVLFGESHLAPNHLPLLIRTLREHDRMLTMLQNVDRVYWLSAGEPQDLVEAVELRDDVVCVFSATPLEKYEHYRLTIDRWKQERSHSVDLAPSFYNLITTLFRFLNVDPYSAEHTNRRAFLVDELPEIWCATRNEEQFEKLLDRRLGLNAEGVRQELKTRGSYFLADRNVIVARDYRMPWAAEQAARSVYHACQKSSVAHKTSVAPEDEFYARVLGSALSFFGSKVLCPARKLFPESEVHDASEPGSRNEGGIRMFGHALGSDLYSAYIRGDITKRWLRGLFFKDGSRPGAAKAIYSHAASRVRNVKLKSA
jgi:Haem-binding uptake, Tiki superfamily, ChaN